MPAPSWQAATAGFSGLAGHVNQFLVTHAVTYLYTGTLGSNRQTAGASSTPSNGTWMAQSFTTAAGQTTVGYVMVNAHTLGTPAGTWAISLQADSAGAPSGTALVTAQLPKEFLGSSFAWQMVALPVSGLTASAQYWIVASSQGDPSNHYSWQWSNQVSGSSTSSNGTTWTPQSNGLMYQVYDATTVMPLAGTWEDNGSRWTALTSNASGQVTAIEEYTAGQAANGYAASARSLSYSNGLLTGVA
jgi:hypothetical protein